MTSLLQKQLFHLLNQAHREACYRENASTQVLKASYLSNGKDVVRSMTAAMGMLGGFHAPVKEAYRVIYLTMRETITYNQIKSDKLDGRVAGFGSSFTKDRDPMLDKLHEFLLRESKAYLRISTEIMNCLKIKGKILYPNLAFYTAWVGMELGYKDYELELLILNARVPEWCKILKEL